MASPRRRKRHVVRLITETDKSNAHAVGLLRRAIRRIECGESAGVILLELMPGDAHNFRLGWSAVPNRFELVGLIEELKHQLLADPQSE